MATVLTRSNRSSACVHSLISCTISLIIATTLSAQEAAEGIPDFRELLEETGMTYQAPQGFTQVQPQLNSLISYEQAVRAPDNALEIRYIIRPVHRLEIDYDDPHSSAPEPDQMFGMLFDTLSNRLSGGRYNPDKTFHPEEAKDQFNADWAAVSAFDHEPAFSQDFSQSLMLAIHKDSRADAYIIFLYNSFDAVRDIIYSNLNSLKFIENL